MSRSLRHHFAQAVPLLLLTASLAGCRQDMHDQPKFFPLRSTSFYSDGRSGRPQVTGTVARSQEFEGSYFNTGMVDGAEGDGLPIKLSYSVLRRGQERYNIYCSPCHSRVGNGKGMVVMRGYYPAANFHTDRLRHAPLGHFFSVITNGYGAMPDHAAQLTPADRWAVVAYIRALQLSQNAVNTDLPSGARVTPIKAVLERSGFSDNFLDSWGGPAPAPATRPAFSRSAALTPVPATQPVATAPATPSTPQPVAAGTATKPAAKPVTVASNAAPAAPPQAAPAKAAGGAGDVEKGKSIYAANCSMCHQPTRAGMPPVFPSLIGVVDRVGEKRVRTVAKEGIPDAKPPMPPHPNLTDQDITDLVAFLKTK